MTAEKPFFVRPHLLFLLFVFILPLPIFHFPPLPPSTPIEDLSSSRGKALSWGMMHNLSEGVLYSLCRRPLCFKILPSRRISTLFFFGFSFGFPFIFHPAFHYPRLTQRSFIDSLMKNTEEKRIQRDCPFHPRTNLSNEFFYLLEQNELCIQNRVQSLEYTHDFLLFVNLNASQFLWFLNKYLSEFLTVDKESIILRTWIILLEFHYPQLRKATGTWHKFRV